MDIVKFIKLHLKLDSLQRLTAKALLEQGYMKASRDIWREDSSLFRAHSLGRTTTP